MNEGDIARNDTAPLSHGGSVSRQRSPEFGTSQLMAAYVAVLAGAVTALLVLQSVLSETAPLAAADLGKAVAAAGLAAIFSGTLSYSAIRLFKRLTRADLGRLLAGDQAPAAHWGSLAVLGVTIGSSVALFHAAAVAMVPMLPAYLAL